ncbi:MAG: AMP-binding protein [Nocardiaceae bacterium]|nr:AMP-binding protein [Nocardiaceae bacterium]
MATLTSPASRLLEHLRNFGQQTALISQREVPLTYAELADQAEKFAQSLGTGRKLVMLAGQNEMSAIVAYLGALVGGHTVLLVPDSAANSDSDLTQIYNPDVIVSALSENQWEILVRHADSVHELHPDLALCLSTSGSTGSPKLVRLSYENLMSNASAIAEYLSITDADRAITTLPMYYCYGLSVIHSHLIRGAGLLITNDSVVDRSFWQFFADNDGTSFAGVPYTFDLLDKAGFEEMDLPRLRYITQAGGRLAPEKVRHYASMGARAGWDFFVMYGATEATARMAYLPPDLAGAHPECIGVPIPGGSFRIEPMEGLDEGTGELVYYGPNVMMGYAQTSDDLANGREVQELRTGDIARVTDSGLYQVVGRSARFIKLFGLRIDLQRIETVLAADGITACCAGTDEKLVVAVEGRVNTQAILEKVAETAHLPKHAIDVCAVAKMPRLGSGKPDYPAIRALAATAAPTATATGVRELFATVLRVPAAEVTDSSTFVALGGDSLSFVTMSARLEKLLGHLPANWHKLSVAELETRRRDRRGILRTVETGIVLRALAILFIVISHTGVIHIEGGAHFLLAASGYYFARFVLSDKPRAERVKHSVTTILRIAVPCLLWIVLVRATLGTYAFSNALFVNRIFGPVNLLTLRLWYVEVLVDLLIVAAVVIAIPAIDRWERRKPFQLATVIALVLVSTRLIPFDSLPHPDLHGFQTVHQWTLFSVFAAFFFAFGWAAAKATTTKQRLLVSAMVVVSLIGYFDPRYIAIARTYECAIFILLLIWVPRMRLPGFLVPITTMIANASLFIFLMHWQVFEVMPHSNPFTLAPGMDPIAIVLSIITGIAVYQGWNRLSDAVEPRLKALWQRSTDRIPVAG